jgi:AGZA family xanthine/uracil permease-like MFS transporter
METMKKSFFVPGDIDGFFGLFIDNLLQLMLIAVLCPTVAGLPAEWVTHRILPGAAISILLGNLFYAWQARRLARATGRSDVTALPYGINTPSLIAFIFLIMGPIYQETKNPALVWQAGLFACLLSGVLETVGAFVGDWLRRHTPRAALLSALSGVAITFIAMGFIFQIFAAPVIALLPMFLILAVYGGRIRLPLGLPGGFVAVLIGVGLAWVMKLAGFSVFSPVAGEFQLALHLPRPYPNDVLELFFSAHGWQYMAVIFPMALFNLIGSLQNLESAEAAGDSYPTKPSLMANGLMSVVAAFLGSPFPTTIYIGHPAWKAMGARTGYSILNGVVITGLCLVGGVALVLKFVPLEATLGILLWIGVVMTAQAFQETPKSHALAVAVGLIPALAAWVLVIIETSLRVAGANLFDTATKFGSDLYIHGIIALSQGFLISSMVLASIVVFFVERKFLHAAIWMGTAAALSLTGVIHAYDLTGTGVQNKFGLAAAPGFAAAYALSALTAVALHFLARPKN